MRNLTTNLERRLRRVDPTVRALVEARVEQQSDIRQRHDQWALLDSIPANVELLPDGGVRLLGTSAAGPSSTVHNSTALAPGDVGAALPYFGIITTDNLVKLAALVDWKGSESNDVVIGTIQAYLDPQPNTGLPANVANWFCVLYTVTAFVVPTPEDPNSYWQLQQLAFATTPASAGAGLVTFDFTTAVQQPRPKSGPALPFGGAYGAGFGAGFVDVVPYTLIMVYGLQKDGTPATNVGWGQDNLHSTAISAAGSVMEGVEIAGSLLTNPAVSAGPGYVIAGGISSTVPALAISLRSYTSADIAFTTASNHLRLSSSPSNSPEFMARMETPPGTSITTKVATSAGGTYVTYTDGQTAADLGLATQQNYYWKATLTPNAAGDATPILRQAGVSEVAITNLSDVAHVERVSWGLDPTTHKAEVPELLLRALHDGERDFRDAITVLLSQNPIGKIILRLWVMDAALSRSDWIHIDDFLIDDYDLAAASARITALSPLVLVRGALPRFTDEIEAYPNSDVAAGSWVASIGTPLYPVLADNNGGIGLLPWNDSDYVRSANNPSSAAFTVGVQAISTPPTNLAYTQVQVQFRAYVESAGQSIALTCELLQSGTVIAGTRVTVNQTSPLSFSVLPTASQLAAISAAGWNGLLQIKFTATGTGRVRVTWARLAVLGIRKDLVYSKQTPQFISNDLLTNQIALPARFLGPDLGGIPGLDGTNAIALSKTISSPAGGATDLTIAKAELDSVAYLAGGFWSSSQGTVLFRRLYDVTVNADQTITYLARSQESVRARIPSGEVAEPIQVTPGFRYRVPEFWAFWGFGNLKPGEYQGEARGALITALTNLGDARVDPIRRLDSTTSQWIPTQELANALAQRQATYFGYGLMVWRFRTTYAHPELELGDVIAVQTDRFIGYDPTAPRSIAGLAWVQCIIVGIFDLWGRDLAVWVPNFSSISATGPNVATPTPTTITTPYDFRVPVSPIHGCVQVVGDGSGVCVVRLENPVGSGVNLVVYELRRAVSGDGTNGRQEVRILQGPLTLAGTITTALLERRDQRDATAIQATLKGSTNAGSWADALAFYGSPTRQEADSAYQGFNEWVIEPDEFPLIISPGSSLLVRSSGTFATLRVAVGFDEIAVGTFLQIIGGTTPLPTSDIGDPFPDPTAPMGSCSGFVYSPGSLSSAAYVQILNPVSSTRVLFIRGLRLETDQTGGSKAKFYGRRVKGFGRFTSSGLGFAGATIIQGSAFRRDQRSNLGTIAILEGTNLHNFDLSAAFWSEYPSSAADGTTQMDGLIELSPHSYPIVLQPDEALMFVGGLANLGTKLYAYWDEFEAIQNDVIVIPGGILIP